MTLMTAKQAGRSSFGNCTSLRHHLAADVRQVERSQFFRDLHFIEARPGSATSRWSRVAVPSGTALHWGRWGLMRLLWSSIPAYCSLCVTFQARLAPSRAAGRAASRRSTSSGPVSRPREQRSVERAGPSSKPIARST